MNILKEIDDQFFSTMEEFLWKEMNNFLMAGIPNDKIQIYFPNYLCRMYTAWLHKYNCIYPEFTEGAIFRLRNVVMNDNYDNTVVVSFKDIQLHSDKYKPAILPVW
jgi:hypothetical protein